MATGVDVGEVEGVDEEETGAGLGALLKTDSRHVPLGFSASACIVTHPQFVLEPSPEHVAEHSLFETARPCPFPVLIELSQWHS